MGLWQAKTDVEIPGQRISPFSQGQACRPSLSTFSDKPYYPFSLLPVIQLAKDTRDIPA